MLLSVIVPMYNVCKYLPTMKKSIDSCTTDNIEFILVDDGSKDETYKKCEELFYDNHSVKIFHNTNHGVSYTRNCGIDYASGEYLMFWDADDLLNNEWDQIVVKAIEENKDCDVIYFTENINTCYPNKIELINSMIGISNKYNNNYLTAPWSKVFRKDIIVNNKLKFNKEIIHGEDLLFNIEFLLTSNKCKIINDSFYMYYINTNSATHNFDKRFLTSNQKYIELLEKILKQHFEDNDIIDSCLSFSFINSLYIFTGKLSKVKKYKESLKIIKDFYLNEFYKNNLKKYKVNKTVSLKSRIVYFCIKFRMLCIVEFFLINFRKKRTESDNKYILV